METVSVFLVEKFFPPRCPKCEHAFASPSDFVEYGGGSGSSFVDAKIRQAKAFPELFGSVEEGHEGVISFTNKFDVDFILCQHCHNVTLRIEYASRQVMSRDEAVRLVATQGFTCWREGVAAGNMTRPYSRLSMLGTADLNALTSHVLRAKERVTHYAEERDKADAFATSIDPALAEIVNKVRETRLSVLAGQRLRALFGPLWEALDPDCRDFLLTAEVLKDDLESLTETDPSIDFSPAVAMYSKALEKDILERIFRKFVRSPQAGALPQTTGSAEGDRSLSILQAFVEGGREPTLGDMAFCLRNLACKMRLIERNGFAEFLRITLYDLDAFCDHRKFPGYLIRYVQEYRNKCAHVAKLSKEACMGARAFLLEEPIRLLVAIEESLRDENRL